MLVLEPSVVVDHLEVFSEVDDESLSRDDVATLLECWDYAVKHESLRFEDVRGVLFSGGCYYFEVRGEGEEEDSEAISDDAFNIFDFIEQKSEDGLVLGGLYARERTGGVSRGLPKHDPWYDPMDVANADDDLPSDAWSSGEFGNDDKVGQVSSQPTYQKPSVFGSSRYQVAPEDEDNEKTGVLDDDDFSTSDLDSPTPVKKFILRVDRTGGIFEVPEGPAIVVGRSSNDAQVQILGDSNISRRHTEMRIGKDGNLHVRDLGSANGTFVDGLNIHSKVVTVKPGQTISLYREAITVLKESY